MKPFRLRPITKVNLEGTSAVEYKLSEHDFVFIYPVGVITNDFKITGFRLVSRRFKDKLQEVDHTFKTFDEAYFYAFAFLKTK